MSGHSKWSQIKRQKGISDIKKSGVFTKLSHNISIAAKKGKDPEMNYALRTAIDAARAANMPKDNITKAILRGAGELPGQELIEIIYEGYGPAGVAMIIQCITDNKNRSSSFIKSTLNKYGGSLGGPNSVAYMFKQKGVIRLDQINEELQLKAIEAGAEDVVEEENGLTIYTQPDQLEKIKKILPKSLYAGADMIAETKAALDKLNQDKLNKLLTELESNDDVNNIYTNA